jgi:hypothetical protein
MDDMAEMEITRMLSMFPQTTDPDLTMETFDLATKGLSAAAIIETAQRFVLGAVEGQSVDFAPSVARFAQEARKRHEHLKPSVPKSLPAPRYFPGPLAPFQVRQQKRLAENAHLPVLFEKINSDQWRKMSLAREIPVGAKFVASLGIVYGPDPKQQSVAAE